VSIKATYHKVRSKWRFRVTFENFCGLKQQQQTLELFVAQNEEPEKRLIV